MTAHSRYDDVATAGGPRAETPGSYSAETGALIDHIVNRFHEAHRRELPELVRRALPALAGLTGSASNMRGLTWNA